MIEFIMSYKPQLLIAFGSILTIGGAFWSAIEDDIKDEKIITGSKEQARLSKQINNILIGEGSYPYVIMAFGSNSEYGVPTIHLAGDYAIENVSGKFLNIRDYRAHQKAGKKSMDYPDVTFKFDFVSPAGPSFLINEAFKISGEGRYLISFFTAYHRFEERLAVERATGKDYYLNAYEIYKDGELLFTEYPEEFPIPLQEIDFLEPLSEYQ